MTQEPRSVASLVLHAGLAVFCAGCAAPREIPLPSKKPWLAAGAELARDAPEDPSAASMPLAQGTPEARAIDLAGALRRATEEGLAFGAAREREAQARADVDILQQSFLPSLRLGAEYDHRLGQFQTTAGALVDVDAESYFGGATAVLVFDIADALFGLAGANQRAESARHAAAAELDATLERAGRLYMDLLESYARLRINEEVFEREGGYLTEEQSRRRLGQGREADLLRAESRTARAESGLVGAREALQLASARLSELLGFSPSTLLLPTEAAIRPIELVPLVGLEGLIEQAQATRPDLAAAESAWRAYEADETYRERRWWVPTLQGQARVGEFGEQLDETESSERYSAAVTWDLSPVSLGESERARAASREARLQLRQTRRRVAEEVVEAFRRAESAVEQSRVLATQVASAEASYQQMETLYRRGDGTLIELLAALDSWNRARTEELAAVADGNRAQLALLRAIGGGGAERRRAASAGESGSGPVLAPEGGTGEAHGGSQEPGGTQGAGASRGGPQE